MEALVPLIFARGKHAIAGILLHDQLGGGLGVGGVSSSKLGMGFENVCKTLSSEWRLAIVGSDWWSQFGINYNVFCI